MNKLFLSSILLLSITYSNSFPFGPSECDLCQLFVTGGKNFLSYNHTISEFEQHLKNTCDFFGPYRDTCKDYITSFTPTYIDLISNNLTAVEICTKTGDCLDNDYLNDFFEDIIEEVEAYDNTDTAYAAYAAYTIESDDILDANITEPRVQSLPIIFELIDIANVGEF